MKNVTRRVNEITAKLNIARSISKWKSQFLAFPSSQSSNIKANMCGELSFVARKFSFSSHHQIREKKSRCDGESERLTMDFVSVLMSECGSYEKALKEAF